MSSDYEDNEAWVNDAWISDDEWPSNGEEGGGQEEDWSETSTYVENEEEDWSETNPSSALNLWCGDTLDNAIENCGRNGYDCPDGICVNDLTCFTVGDSCSDSENTESLGSAAPSLSPRALTSVPTPIVSRTSQPQVAVAEPGIPVNNFGLIGQYCASTLAALETECITATTCENSDDCPPGTYCWGERVCGFTNTTNTPIMSSTPPLSPSSSPMGLMSYSPSLIGSGLASEQQPQPSTVAQSVVTGSFVCGTDLSHALTNCHKPCPSGSYEECDDGEACFENISCEVNSTPTLPPQLDIATQPTQVVTNSLPPSRLSSDLSSEQYFCASTIEELEASCDTAQSCADGPCPMGVFCFPYTCNTAVHGENPATINSAKSQEPILIEPSAAPVQVSGLCPQSPFVGWHTSADCKGMFLVSTASAQSSSFVKHLFFICRYVSEYFQCDNGAMGVVFVCGASLKFDKVRNECHPEQYVNSFCYGPPKGKETNASSELCAEDYVGWETSNYCHEYFWCDGGRFDVVYYCPDNQLFDKGLGHCNPASQVNCINRGGGSTVTNVSSSPTTTLASGTQVNGSLVGNLSWSDAPMSSPTQNTSYDTPPWLSNTVMTTNSCDCKMVAGRKVFVGVLYLLWLSAK